MEKDPQNELDQVDYIVGNHNTKKWGLDIQSSVFGVSAALIFLSLIYLLVLDTEVARDYLNDLRYYVTSSFDLLFIWASNFFFLFALFLLFSPFAKIRIGGEEAKPEFSTLSWISMLFTTGMGIGLLFWSVAEPAAYYTNWWGTPLNVEPFTEEARTIALGSTVFHWGLQAWSIYAIVAISLAFFTFNKGLPFSLRSVLYPIIGERIWGWVGHIIDILAVIVTLFGLATSLGFGAQQATAGINHIFDLNIGISFQIILIIFITLIAVMSVVKGINNGVKILSNINMIIGFILLSFIIFTDVDLALKSIWDSTISYIKHIAPLSNPHGREDVSWYRDWTVFYWAWWVSWSPFVGMFIARVSKGRTIRSLLAGIIFVPSLIILVWMSVFGGITIEQISNNIGDLGTIGITDVSLTLFQLYDGLNYKSYVYILSIALILLFFITSSDSGSLIIDNITAGGKIDVPLPQRIFWTSLEGAIAIVMLWIGGEEALYALQSGVVITALPFTIILLLMCISLIKELKSELPKYSIQT